MMNNPYPSYWKHFLAETKNHRLTVIHDDGDYKHLRMSDPDKGGIFSWSIITWPGHIAISGDICDGFIFTPHGNADALRWAYRGVSNNVSEINRYNDGARIIDHNYMLSKLSGVPNHHNRWNGNSLRELTTDSMTEFIQQIIADHIESNPEALPKYSENSGYWDKPNPSDEDLLDVNPYSIIAECVAWSMVPGIIMNDTELQEMDGSPEIEAFYNYLRYSSDIPDIEIDYKLDPTEYTQETIWATYILDATTTAYRAHEQLHEVFDTTTAYPAVREIPGLTGINRVQHVSDAIFAVRTHNDEEYTVRWDNLTALTGTLQDQQNNQDQVFLLDRTHVLTPVIEKKKGYGPQSYDIADNDDPNLPAITIAVEYYIHHMLWKYAEFAVGWNS